jgi:muconate cycloisomerase
MFGIASFDLYAVDLPFRLSFKHAKAERKSSYSLFLKCTLDNGISGFGECLPRNYVTGESRSDAFVMLESKILPRLVGRAFASFEEVTEFLRQCDGKAPGDWVPPDQRQTAAWCAVDLALLDSFGKVFETVAYAPGASWPADLRYSGALASRYGWRLYKAGLRQRLFGLRTLKMKVDEETSERIMRAARRTLGRRCKLRVDANMAWNVDQAVDMMAMMARFGVSSFEQPLPADDLAGQARLVAETGLGVMADESLHDAGSLERLIEAKACTAVNVRVSKCGGLVASAARCRRALEAGLTVQIGCQVGESSLLSSAHLALVSKVQQVTYVEGCFGERLLLEDPGSPLLQFGYGGHPPERPSTPGLGIEIDESIIERHCIKRSLVSGASGP